MSNENKNNFFAYKNMEMYVNGQPSVESDWGSGNEATKLIFRLGKDDEYYEIRQNIYSDWDQRNHIYINLRLQLYEDLNY